MSMGCEKILSATELERYRVRVERTLPRKGKKEFAPTFTWVECKLLEAARDERHALLKDERVERVGALSVAEWDEKANLAVVTYTVGRNWEFFGHQQGEVKLLHPEEALFLLETTSLLLLHNNVGLSIQQGYNTLLGKRTGCSLACYRVFSHLARQGFRLKRHDGPVYVLTDYERRIGLESYLYPSKHTSGNLLTLNNNSNIKSETVDCHQNTEDSMICQTIDNEVSTVVKSEIADGSHVSHIVLGNQIRNDSVHGAVSSVRKTQAMTKIKRKNTEILSVTPPEPQSGVSVSNFTENFCDSFATSFKREQQEDTHNTLQESQFRSMMLDTRDKSHCYLNTDLKKEQHEASLQTVELDGDTHETEKKYSNKLAATNESSNVRRKENTCEIKREQVVETCVSESTVSNVNNFQQSTVTVANNCHNDVSSDAVIKTENMARSAVQDEGNSLSDIVPVEDFSDNAVKKEVLVECANSCEIVGSAEGRQQSKKDGGNRMSEKQNLQISPDVSLARDCVKRTGKEKSTPTTSTNFCAPVVDLTKSLQNFQRKRQKSHETIFIEGSSRSMNPKTVNASESSQIILKCDIDNTDVSSVDNTSDVSVGTSNSRNNDIFCVTHKKKNARKRPISHQKSHKKAKKSYVVDVETGTVVCPYINFVPEKKAKQELNREIDEIIVSDDSDIVIEDSDIVIDNSNSSCRNETLVEIKGEELEQELSKFYEEITLIDLTTDDSRIETRSEILDLFPNFAGVRIATIKAPPSNLLPENVAPSQQEYCIELGNLCANRPACRVRRYFKRGRDAHHRSKFRGRHFRRPHYRRSPQNQMSHDRMFGGQHNPEEFSNHYSVDHERQMPSHGYSSTLDTQPQDRMYGGQQNNPEEFSNHYTMDNERQMPSLGYSSTFDTQAQDHMALAIIDTTGTFIPVRRFEYQHGLPSRTPNKQWYERTWTPNTGNESFVHHSDTSPMSSPHYEQVAHENNHRGGADNYQRWNRRYPRSTNYRGDQGGRSQFRHSYDDSSARRSNFQEHPLKLSWQKFQNVAPSAESWSDFKMIISGRNLQKGLIKRDCDSPIKSEDGDSSEELVLPFEQPDEETEIEEVEWKPLIEPTDCTDIGSILTKLRIFKEVHCNPHQIASVDAKLKINYDIYLPTTKFKKSAPCLPDYRLCVTESEDDVPTAGEVSVLLKELQDDVPLLFAIVVPDSIAFYHFANISLPVDDSFTV